MSYEEIILENDYPVYYSYFYIIDGEVKRNTDIMKGTVRDLKNHYNAKEIKSCDCVRRGLL